MKDKLYRPRPLAVSRQPLARPAVSWEPMFFNRTLARREGPFPLVVGMTGVKLGDRVLQVGCAQGGPLAAIAAKVGLSGRVLAVVPDATCAARVDKASARAGVLVEVQVAPLTHLPAEDGSFELVIVDDLDGSFGAMRADDRGQVMRDAARVVRPGGRAMVIGRAPRQGIAALFSRGAAGPSLAASGGANDALEVAGFRGVRTLAERDGLVFVEGIKPRQAQAGGAG